MFDFIRDIVAEANGLDVELMRVERRKKRKSKALISRGSKIIIFVIGMLYLIVSGVNISYEIRMGIADYFTLRYVVLSVIDVMVLVFMFCKKKWIQVIAVVGILLFVILNYFFMMF